MTFAESGSERLKLILAQAGTLRWPRFLRRPVERARSAQLGAADPVGSRNFLSARDRLQIEELFSKVSLRERVVVALSFCGLIFWLDSVTSATFLAAGLYIPVAGVFCGVRKPTLLVAFCVVCTVLSGSASLSDFDQTDFLNFAINRGVITLVLYLMCLLIHWHNSTSEVLRLLATTDPLTGALNRRHFMELMAREHRRADRHGATYSLIMVDIDHFKRINDKYGHQVGDNAIQAMADVCKKVSRSTDMVARYGGEEFIVTLTHTDQACALIFAEHLRIAASEIAIPSECGALKFTISIGVATYRNKSSIDEIIRRADCALYRAKTGGRNQVCAEDHSDRVASARDSDLSHGETRDSIHLDEVNVNAA